MNTPKYRSFGLLLVGLKHHNRRFVNSHNPRLGHSTIPPFMFAGSQIVLSKITPLFAQEERTKFIESSHKFIEYY